VYGPFGMSDFSARAIDGQTTLAFLIFDWTVLASGIESSGYNNYDLRPPTPDT
jgi:hypothetical protein